MYVAETPNLNHCNTELVTEHNIKVFNTIQSVILTDQKMTSNVLFVTPVCLFDTVQA